MLRGLYDWTLSLAARKSAEWWLAIIAFVESSVFLVPADVLFLPMSLSRPGRAYRYALVATVASVLGGIAGWFIGHYAYDALARPILEFYGKFDEFEHLRLSSGDGIILLMLVTSGLAHLPPIKVVTILAGAVTLGASVTTLVVTGSRLVEILAFIVAGWVALAATGIWLARTVPRALKRISTMSRAYRVERQASETEARRRQGARLLHDTVLATLTLLAHSGVGVSVGALREQAAEDAALLRQLRLGFTPDPTRSGDYRLKPVEESTLGNTLESVKQRFRRMGLEVNWHGAGQVLLPSDVLDSFLLALGECLENVRRHSGVNEAHVTITDDETTVRAMVTDAGKGFDVASIEEGRLGFTESIVARLRDVGGNARLFSSPGSGTTVVLEVPK